MNEVSSAQQPGGFVLRLRVCVSVCLCVCVFARQHAAKQTHTRDEPAACARRRREVQADGSFCRHDG